MPARSGKFALRFKWFINNMRSGSPFCYIPRRSIVARVSDVISFEDSRVWHTWQTLVMRFISHLFIRLNFRFTPAIQKLIRALNLVLRAHGLGNFAKDPAADKELAMKGSHLPPG